MVPPLFRRPFQSTYATDVPNMDTIESSLHNCSLSRRENRSSHPAHLPVGGLDPETAAITVELNSEAPLPNPWEQLLNIQTGEIYYVNRANGTKTSHDPRRLPSCESDPESAVEDGEDDDDDGSDTYSASSDESSDYSNSINIGSTGISSSPSSSTSSAISTTTTATSASSSATSRRRRIGGGASPVLVLVGCKVCLTLSMVARPGLECPKCASSLLRHF